MLVSRFVGTFIVLSLVSLCCQGYQIQSRAWPLDPLDTIIAALLHLPASSIGRPAANLKLFFTDSMFLRQPVFRRIRMRLRIQHFRSIRIRIQGFYDQEVEKIYS